MSFNKTEWPTRNHIHKDVTSSLNVINKCLAAAAADSLIKGIHRGDQDNVKKKQLDV